MVRIVFKYIAQAGATIWDFSLASWFYTFEKWVTILTPIKFDQTKRFCSIYSNRYQNDKKVWRGFLPTSGQIPLTSDQSEWLNWDPHMVIHSASSRGAIFPSFSRFPDFLSL